MNCKLLRRKENHWKNVWVEGKSRWENVIIYLSDKFMGNVGLELAVLRGKMGRGEDWGEMGEDGGRRGEGKVKGG